MILSLQNTSQMRPLLNFSTDTTMSTITSLLALCYLILFCPQLNSHQHSLLHSTAKVIFLYHKSYGSFLCLNPPKTSTGHKIKSKHLRFSCKDWQLAPPYPSETYLLLLSSLVRCFRCPGLLSPTTVPNNTAASGPLHVLFSLPGRLFCQHSLPQYHLLSKALITPSKDYLLRMTNVFQF